MEILEGKKRYEKEKIAKGTVITFQGSPNKAFHVLHTGLVEFLCCDEVESNESPEQIIERSYRVGMAKGKALLDVVGLLDVSEPYALSVRCVSDCVISRTPMKSEVMAERIQRNMSLNLRILKNMVSQVDSGFYLYKNYKYLWHKAAYIADVLALNRSGEVKAGDKVSRLNSELDAYASYLASRTGEEIELPEAWDINLFTGDLPERLELYKDKDIHPLEEAVDHRQYLFVKRIVEKQDNLLSALFHHDEPLNFYIYKFLSETQEIIQRATGDLSREIRDLMDQIYRERGWVEQTLSRGKPSGQQAAQFLHYLTTYSSRCRKDSMNLLGKDLYDLFPVFKDLKAYKVKPVEPKREEGTSQRLSAGSRFPRLAKYDGLLDKILQFSGHTQAFNDEFKTIMDGLLSFDDPSSTDKEASALRERLIPFYWELYERCFLKVIDTDLKGFIPGIMLHLGVVDERFIVEEDLLVMDRLYSANLYSEDPVPAMTLPYFLERIYKGEMNPSVTEMGDSFGELLKTQKKLSPKEKKAVTRIYEDTPEDRVRYELSHIATELSRLITGNKKRALPFLSSRATSGRVEKLFWEPDNVANRVEKVREKDYSVFFRETLFKYGERSDLIMEEFFPLFVLYPVFGSRPMMWQDMDGIKKTTQGRLFLPLYFEGKRDESIIHLLAHFRWELQKTIAGFNWTDPVEGGLVGAYYDYLQYYRKNPDLSAEARKRLADLMKRVNTDKDRFAEEYLGWIRSEYEGRVKLNPASRAIFYRFCPFPKKVRQWMSEKPLYSSHEARLSNRRQKEIVRIQAKLKKQDEPIPQEIEAYLEYLEVDQ